MDHQEIKQLLTVEMPECTIAVDGENGKYQVTAVGQVFAGMSAVKRQQQIYRVLGESIASGAIHAISMRLYTPEEHAAIP